MILNNIEVNVLATIELIDAYNKNYPLNFIFKNVIYCIHNNINNKNYIGQTTEFRNRFSNSYVGHFRDYELYISGDEKKKRALYNSWKKYGLEAFTVYIIDIGKSHEELDEKEMYWIKTLHTCTKDPECFGYNLTWGADDIGFLKEGAINKSLATRLEKYREYFHNCHTPEVLEKGRKTKEERYGVSTGFVNVYTPEANAKRIQTNLERYGNTNGFRRDLFEKRQQENLEKYGNIWGDPEVRKQYDYARRLTLCFKRIDKILSNNILIKTLEDYIEELLKNYTKTKSLELTKNHLRIVFELYNDLSKDSRWTPQLDSIFKLFSKWSLNDLENFLTKIADQRKQNFNKLRSLKTKGI